MLNCAIIDDDEIARLTLERFIEDSADLHLVASLPGPMEALAFLKSGQKADLLFLDVQMPLLSGLELLRLLPAPPKVVLITSRPDFAVEAFELQVSDYLVKPFDFERFRQAVERVSEQLRVATAPPATPEGSAGVPAAMFIKSSTRHVRVPLADILYVEAVSNYAVVVTRGQQVVSNQSFKELADRLPSGTFERVHRSYIINRDHIEAVEDKVIHFIGGRSVPIGKTYLSDFMASLKV
ncbi:MAG: response regulator transcription factor [Hymenobacteraceae bacterium]|nr:response regulator transcription factor [Hymenobacteraceae bacterium]